jgi:hypothetical protein
MHDRDNPVLVGAENTDNDLIDLDLPCLSVLKEAINSWSSRASLAFLCSLAAC